MHVAFVSSLFYPGLVKLLIAVELLWNAHVVHDLLKPALQRGCGLGLQWYYHGVARVEYVNAANRLSPPAIPPLLEIFQVDQVLHSRRRHPDGALLLGPL